MHEIKIKVDTIGPDGRHWKKWVTASLPVNGDEKTLERGIKRAVAKVIEEYARLGETGEKLKLSTIRSFTIVRTGNK